MFITFHKTAVYIIMWVLCCVLRDLTAENTNLSQLLEYCFHWFLVYRHDLWDWNNKTISDIHIYRSQKKVSFYNELKALILTLLKCNGKIKVHREKTQIYFLYSTIFGLNWKVVHSFLKHLCWNNVAEIWCSLHLTWLSNYALNSRFALFFALFHSTHFSYQILLHSAMTRFIVPPVIHHW